MLNFQACNRALARMQGCSRSMMKQTNLWAPSSPQADAFFRAAETILVFTKEAFHVLTGVGKKGE